MPGFQRAAAFRSPSAHAKRFVQRDRSSCLVLPTQLLRDVKPSHQVDLTYLYYLPFCTVFTSKDRFHAQIVPLFLDPFQTFVSGTDLKDELKKLNERYMALPDDVRRTGLMTFAQEPPKDDNFLTARLWDKYLPGWREERHNDISDPEIQKGLMEIMEKMADDDKEGVESHDEFDLEKIDHLTVKRQIKPLKGNYWRISEEIARRE